MKINVNLFLPFSAVTNFLVPQHTTDGSISHLGYHGTLEVDKHFIQGGGGGYSFQTHLSFFYFQSLGEAPEMSEVRKSWLWTKVLHTFGDRARSHWLGQVSTN